MSDPIKDGGPAFPVLSLAAGGRINQPYGGMSLRDWFAGQALAGLMACPNISAQSETFAASAYTYADAMLKAREGKQ